MQSALDGNYIHIVLQTPWRMDKTAIRVINESCPEFLLPFGMTDMNDETTLKYKVPNAISLRYMNGSFTKQMFLDFYEGLLDPFVRGYDWFLDYHYICVVPDYIYVNRQTIKSSFLYIPEQSYYNTDEEIITFLKNVLNKVLVTDDSAFLVQLYQYFNNGNVVLSDLDNMIKTEKNKTASKPVMQAGTTNAVPQPQKSEKATAPGSVVQQLASNAAANTLSNAAGSAVSNAAVNAASGQQPSQSSASEASDNDMMNALFGSPSKKKEKTPKVKKQHDKSDKKEKPEKAEKGFFGGGFFGKKKGKTPPVESQQPQQQPSPQIVPQRNQTVPSVMQNAVPVTAPIDITTEDSSATVIAGMSYQAEKCLALMESVQAGAIARISLDFPKDYITIGRESNDAIQPDIRFDRSFTQISRMHLRIERRDDGYYAVDMGSGNHTMIDGQMMMPNIPYKLNAGSVLSIAVDMPVKYRVNI